MQETGRRRPLGVVKRRSCRSPPTSASPRAAFEGGLRRIRLCRATRSQWRRHRSRSRRHDARRDWAQPLRAWKATNRTGHAAASLKGSRSHGLLLESPAGGTRESSGAGHKQELFARPSTGGALRERRAYTPTPGRRPPTPCIVARRRGLRSCRVRRRVGDVAQFGPRHAARRRPTSAMAATSALAKAKRRCVA